MLTQDGPGQLKSVMRLSMGWVTGVGYPDGPTRDFSLGRGSQTISETRHLITLTGVG